jgi:hypothetical protein
MFLEDLQNPGLTVENVLSNVPHAHSPTSVKLVVAFLASEVQADGSFISGCVLVAVKIGEPTYEI